MAETLTLATPETFPSVTTWKVETFTGDSSVPHITVVFLSNTNQRRVWRLAVDAGAPLNTIQAGLSYINQGKFQTVQGKSLQKWLLEQWQANGGPAGTITGTPD